MAKKRRRRKKNRGQHDEGQFFDDEENATPARGQDYICEDGFKFLKLLGIRIRRSLFKPGGFRCTYCGFRTKKLATAGRNAMRAHHKKHLHDARAGRRLRLAVWLGVLLVMGATTYAIDSTFGIVIVESWGNDLSWDEHVGPALAGISIAISAVILAFAFLYTRKRRKRWQIAFNVSFALAFANILAQVAVVVDVVRLEVAWPWYLSGLLPLGALGLTRKKVGLTALNVSRRDVKPRHYIKMFKSITADGDMRIIEIQLEIEQMIREGRLDTSKLPRWQRLALVTLEILKIGERL